MDEKEVDVSSARNKRSKSVPAMSPAILNDTQLQDQPIVGRSRSNTVDSVDRLVRTQRRGARLSSGGLLRNQSKKRKNKDALVKSRSVDVLDQDERNNSSRKSSNSSESSDVHEEDEALVRARKQGFCFPAVNGVFEKLKTMEDEQEFSSNIDSDQTNSSVVCSANKESFVGDQQLNSTAILHDDSKLSEYKKPYENYHPSESTDNGDIQENSLQEQTFDFQESKINIRRKSLPANLSEYEIYSNLGDYCEAGHEYCTRLMSTNQTDMKFQNNYRIVYRKRCKNKSWRRWQSLPESLYKVNETTADSNTEQVAASLDERETAVSVESVDQGLSNMQDSCQLQEDENPGTLESCNENVEDDDTMADKPILEQQHSPNSEENFATKEQVKPTKRSSKIKRSFSLPVKFDIVNEDDSQEKENGELKRTKSLTTGDEFNEVFPVMLSEQTAGFKLEPDIENINGKLQEDNGEDQTAVVRKKSRRGKGRDRRRAKSLPVTLALEEIPEESAEQYCCNEYESVEDMAKKHINKAFQELLRRIQKSQQPRNKVKRTRSLSTIKEATASNETLNEVESRQKEDVTLENAGEQHEEQSADHEQEYADLTSHEYEPERDEQHEPHDIHEEDTDTTVSEESHSQNQEENNDEVELLQQPKEQDSVLMKRQEKEPKEEIKSLQEENGKPQLPEDAEDETFALQQELLHENNEAKEVPMNKENDEQLDNTTQQSIVINESLNEHVVEEIPNIHKAKEELHIDIPQIFVDEVECEQSQLSDVDAYGGDIYDDVDGCEEQEGSDEQYISPKTEELKSPDDEDIQGTILEHINNIDFAFDHNINQRSIVNVSCMERIPEDPDKETAMESEETELKPTETECDSAGIGFDSTDAMEEQSKLKRAGSMRKIKRGKMSGSSRKKSWPITSSTNSESNGPQKRVTWSDFPRDTTEGEDDQVDQEDGFMRDQFEPGPRGDLTFSGSDNDSEDVTQDEFEEGPRGEIRFTGTLDEHGTQVDQSDRYESDEFDLESKFDTLARNAVNSYLEPDYSQSESPIHRAVAMGNVDHLKKLIDEGADVNALDEHGWPPLHVASLFYKVDCAELLLEAGADLQDYTDSLVHEYQTLKEIVC